VDLNHAFRAANVMLMMIKVSAKMAIVDAIQSIIWIEQEENLFLKERTALMMIRIVVLIKYAKNNKC
jgi:hypothetical protein